MFTIGIYITREKLDQNPDLAQLLTNSGIKQTEVKIYTSLSPFRFHNMIYIDCEFETDELNKTFDLISEHYLSTRNDDYPNYSFVRLFTNPEVTKQCTIKDKNGYADYKKELNLIYKTYHLHPITCANVLFTYDIRKYYQLVSGYSMAYWGYLKHGTHRRGK